MIDMITTPIAIKVVPIAIAGMIAISPISPQRTEQTLDMARQKIVAIVHKEGYTTTIDQNGEQVQLPYKEKTTIERPNDYDYQKSGIIMKTIHGTISTVKTIYWWVVK
jgi:hypothetical protein